MKRLDDGKVSLVDFLNSIKFAPHDSYQRVEKATPFAHLSPRTRSGSAQNGEDHQAVRSAN